MSFSLRLTRRGLRHETSDDGQTHVRVHRPRTIAALLRFWHYELAGIDEDVTLGDLLALLRRVRNIAQLGPLFSCDIEAFLREAEQPATDDTSDVRYLEVYNTAELSGWEEGPPGARYSRGRFVAPYAIHRGFHGWGPWEALEGVEGPGEGGIAIEFSPLPELVKLPLRYNPNVAFEKEKYQGSVLDTQLTITFGAFVHAVIWEIGFFGSPGDRNEQRHEFLGVVDDVNAAMDAGNVAGEEFDLDAFMGELDSEADEEDRVV